MSDFSASISALGANMAGLWTAAANIANQNTPGYKAVHMQTSAAPEGGVTVSFTRDNSPVPLVPASDGSLEGSNVSLAREITGAVTYLRGFQANARVISLLEETKGTLLDVVG